MTLDPRATPVSPFEVREQARRQARGLSAGLLAAAGGVVALLLVAALVALDYTFDQDAHRLFKILLGVAGVVTILIVPRTGLFLLPLAVPYLGWMPRIPVPMLNAVNVLVLAVFFAWIVARVQAGKPVFRGGSLGVVLGVYLLCTALALGRGIAFPPTADYTAGFAATTWFRSTVPFLVFFMGMSMLRGAADRRRMSWLLVLAVAAEAVTTIMLGGNGSAGRAVGSFDQPNVLGSYLAMFTCLAAAMAWGTRAWWLRLACLAVTGAAILANFATLSRGALLAVGAGLLYVSLRSSRLMTALLLLVTLTGPLWAPDHIKERIASTSVEVEGTDEVELEGSAQKRINTWNAIMDVAAEHPLHGVGYAGLSLVLYEVGAGQGIEGVARSAHNSFLRALGEMGIGGFAVFVWLFWSCFSLSLLAARHGTSRADRAAAIGLGGATLALAVSCWFGDRFIDNSLMSFWLLCAVVQDQVLELRRRAAAERARVPAEARV